MALTWTPDPGAPLFVRFESDPGPFSWTITAQVETPGGGDGGGGGQLPASVERYSGTITPEQDRLTVTGGSASLTVTAETLNGLFPIVFIDYIADTGELKRVDDWEDLPRGARDVVEFRPNGERSQTYTLNAKALLSSGETVTARFNMIILHDWTPGRDRLIAEVDARRR